MIRLPYLNRRGNKPGFKGVRSNRKTFTAQVYKGGRRYHLGSYPTEAAAAWAVNEGLSHSYSELPPRFLNVIPAEVIPSLEEQESIRREVRLRLGLLS